MCINYWFHCTILNTTKENLREREWEYKWISVSFFEFPNWTTTGKRVTLEWLDHLILCSFVSYNNLFLLLNKSHSSASELRKPLEIGLQLAHHFPPSLNISEAKQSKQVQLHYHVNKLFKKGMVLMALTI